MSSEKSPYKHFTIEQVEAAERGHFYIQIGQDIFTTETGHMAFNKDKTDKFFLQLWDALDHMKKTGNKKEVEDAHICLNNLKIFPLRIH